VVGIAGFRGERFVEPPQEYISDMDHQAKVRAQGSNFFFADGQGARQPVVGTVPMGFEMPEKSAAAGHVDLDGYSFGHGSGYLMTGKVENGSFWGDGFPKEITVDEKLIRRGEQVYTIHCAVCHGISGNGKGALALRQDTSKASYGIANIANFTDVAFTDPANAGYKPAGMIFDTITNGKGLMGRYGNNITVKDRWATIAYLRTLALARSAPLSHPKVKEAWDAHKANK
jgi:mono/diheme cytochrome c family protein